MAGLAEFGALIKRARVTSGMTQEEASQLLGRPHTFLVRIENGRNSNPPDPQTFTDLERVFGVPKRTMLQALGYLDPAELEPGVAYVVYEGDPRLEIMHLLEGLIPEDVRILTQALTVLKTYSQNNAPVLASNDQHVGTNSKSTTG